MDPLAYNEVRSRPSLEERLESIISAAALMADADCTRDERRERIVAECNAVRQALQDLLSEYMANVSIIFVYYSYNNKFLHFLFQIYNFNESYWLPVQNISWYEQCSHEIQKLFDNTSLGYLILKSFLARIFNLICVLCLNYIFRWDKKKIVHH